MKPIDAKKIWEQVKENGRRLNTCHRHDFDPVPGSLGKYRCVKCGGKLDGVAVYWYRKGIEHGKNLT